MSTFEVSRTAVIEADPARVWDLVADLHRWPSWSPWDDGVEVERSYGGPVSGVGATCSWMGGRRAGSGSMAITGATQHRIDVTLKFLRPFRSTNQTTFALDPTPTGATEVTWTIRGERTGLAGALSRLVRLDRMLARDFDRGLARLGASARA